LRYNGDYGKHDNYRTPDYPATGFLGFFERSADQIKNNDIAGAVCYQRIDFDMKYPFKYYRHGDYTETGHQGDLNLVGFE
jgi:hypothetical protein